MAGVSRDEYSPVASLLGRNSTASEHVLQRMMLQLVELEVLFEALDRSVAAELLETGDMDALRNPARDRPSLHSGCRRPRAHGHQTKAGVDRYRIGTNPHKLIALGFRKLPLDPSMASSLWC
jgi:hypothetical protein